MKFKVSLQNSPFDMPQSEDHRTHCVSTQSQTFCLKITTVFFEKRISDLLLYPEKTEFLTIGHQWPVILSGPFLAGHHLAH